MALEINHAIISGRLGRDVEVKQGKNGTSYANFSIANSRTYGGESRTSWVNCAIFGKTAENLGPHLLKGKLIVVTGQIVVEDYEVDGQKRQSTKLVANNIQFAEPKGDSGQASTGSKNGAKARAKAAPAPEEFDFDEDDEESDDEIPF